MKYCKSKVPCRSHGHLDSGTVRGFHNSGVPHDLIRSEVGSSRVRRGVNAYFGDLTYQPDRTTDIVVHFGTVHARGDISHIEAVVALTKGER